MATTTKKSSPATAPSLARVLQGSRDDFTLTIKDWTSFVRAVPSSVATPSKLVVRYFGVREQALARRRDRAVALIEAAPKVRVPTVKLPTVRRSTKDASAAPAA